MTHTNNVSVTLTVLVDPSPRIPFDHYAATYDAFFDVKKQIRIRTQLRRITDQKKQHAQAECSVCFGDGLEDGHYPSATFHKFIDSIDSIYCLIVAH